MGDTGADWSMPKGEKGEALRLSRQGSTSKTTGPRFIVMLQNRMLLIRTYQRHMTNEEDKARADRTLEYFRNQII